jgi:hypothetical protein
MTMIGVLFHGPEVFDSGWAGRIIQGLSSVDTVRCVLAGTMGRTAVFDSGLQGIECPGTQPGSLVKELESGVDAIVFANYGKSEHAGLTFGAMVVQNSGASKPTIQAECSSACFVEWIDPVPPGLISVLENLGMRRVEPIKLEPSIWEQEGRTYRRMTTAAPGEFVLVNGIIIGRATGGEGVIECENRRVTKVTGVKIKAHGLEKLDRLGGVDLRQAKLVSTPTIRRTPCTPRMKKTSGHGIAFVDHAGMYVYDLVQNVEGAVTVGDDTTAVVGDILYRFQLPLIGIIDGDKDTILSNTHFTPGSVTFQVREDDRSGLKVFSEIFRNRITIDEGFAKVRDRIAELVRNDLVKRQNY